MLRRVFLVRTDISEELSTSFIRVTRIGEIGTTLAVSSNRVRRLLVTANVVSNSPILVTLKKEALSSSEMSVLTRNTRRNIPEGLFIKVITNRTVFGSQHRLICTNTTATFPTITARCGWDLPSMKTEALAVGGHAAMLTVHEQPNWPARSRWGPICSILHSPAEVWIYRNFAWHSKNYNDIPQTESLGSWTWHIFRISKQIGMQRFTNWVFFRPQMSGVRHLLCWVH
jgi:hypothetical protein